MEGNAGIRVPGAEAVNGFRAIGINLERSRINVDGDDLAVTLVFDGGSNP